ncbi:hypothetical protein E5Q_03505 [Mixia osmundae IAM 14324]|uniref:Uncharacterized protein n=1 Tax=Mixia osmundae (strain CBS 9802 / IAM 14324 / JCM 22182 / KY 12970) TaxID=764103 RepID=G7E1Z5_MIXOS|nr:hypothetical protein E5Q_03505 [Mixia osmundae IAM 14324]
MFNKLSIFIAAVVVISSCSAAALPDNAAPAGGIAPNAQGIHDCWIHYAPPNVIAMDAISFVFTNADFTKVSQTAPAGVTATYTQGNSYVEWTMGNVDKGIAETIVFDVYYTGHEIVGAKMVSATKGTVSGFDDWDLFCNNVNVHKLN